MYNNKSYKLIPNNKSYKLMPNEKGDYKVLKIYLLVVLWSKRSKKNLIKNIKSTLSKNLIKNVKKVSYQGTYQESKQSTLSENLIKNLKKVLYRGTLSRI